MCRNMLSNRSLYEREEVDLYHLLKWRQRRRPMRDKTIKLKKLQLATKAMIRRRADTVIIEWCARAGGDVLVVYLDPILRNDDQFAIVLLLAFFFVSFFERYSYYLY